MCNREKFPARTSTIFNALTRFWWGIGAKCSLNHKFLGSSLERRRDLLLLAACKGYFWGANPTENLDLFEQRPAELELLYDCGMEGRDWSATATPFKCRAYLRTSLHLGRSAGRELFLCIPMPVANEHNLRQNSQQQERTKKT